MSIHALFNLIEPNQRITDDGSVQAVIDRVGIPLPKQLVQIALCYGFGHFLAEHREFRSEVHVYDPTAEGYRDNVFYEEVSKPLRHKLPLKGNRRKALSSPVSHRVLKLPHEILGWNDHCSALEIQDISFYPEENGLLPMAMFDNTVKAAFVCTGPPDEWQILAFETLYQDETECSRFVYELSPSEFLVNVLTGQLPELIGIEVEDKQAISSSFVSGDSWYGEEFYRGAYQKWMNENSK